MEGRGVAVEKLAMNIDQFSRIKVKVTHTRLPSVGFRSSSWFFAVCLQVTWVINPAVGCQYFPPGPQLLSQALRRLLPVSLLGKQRHDGCEQFAWDFYPTAQRLRFEPRRLSPACLPLGYRRVMQGKAEHIASVNNCKYQGFIGAVKT